MPKNATACTLKVVVNGKGTAPPLSNCWRLQRVAPAYSATALPSAASGPHATDQSFISTQFGCFRDSAAAGADTPIGELRYNLGANKAADFFSTSARLECDTRVDAPELRAGSTLRINAASGTGYVTLGLTAEGVLGFFFHASEGAAAQEMHSMRAI